MDHLFDIITMEGNVVGVKRGSEVVSINSGCFKLSYQSHIPMDRTTSVLINERVLGLDSVDIGNIDYSYKSVKPILHDEAKIMEIAQAQAVIPVLYGGMPDLGRFYTMTVSRKLVRSCSPWVRSRKRWPHRKKLQSTP